MKYFSILLLASLFLISCGDREDPQIRFITPANNTAVDAGEVVPIQVEVTDNEQISTITVGGDVQPFSIPPADFADIMKHTFLFNLTINEGSPSGGEVNVTVTATDAEGNSGSDNLVLVIN